MTWETVSVAGPTGRGRTRSSQFGRWRPQLVQFDRSRHVWPWLRVPSATLVCLALGTVAHLSGGGHSPDLARTVVAITAVTVLWMRVAGVGPSASAASTLRVTAAVLASQGVVHLALTCPNPGQPSWAGGVDSGDGLFIGLSNGLHTVAHAGPSTGQPLGPAGGADLLIALGHLLAALGTAWWLARGEQAVWAWARRVVAAFSAQPVRIIVRRVRAARIAAETLLPVPVPVLCHGLRAPPA